MSDYQHSIRSWGVALTEEQTSLLRETLGAEYHLAAHPTIGAALEDEPLPFIIWLSTQGLCELSALPAPLRLTLEDTPKALLLGPDHTSADFEAAYDMGISDVTRAPLTKERLASIMRRALEARTAHNDMERMAHEISVERERLERKNNILAFLVNFLANSTDNLNIEDLLRGAFANMAKLLPVTSMHAALWENEEGDFSKPTLYIAAPEGTTAYHAWKETLISHACHFSYPRSVVPQTISLCLNSGSGDSAHMPPAGHSLLRLPLVCGQECLGILLLQTATEQYLERDQSVALDSALSHFSLTIKNARRVRQLQRHADYDALTQVYNRRHFEHRMEKETQCFSRYGNPLAMIMIDIDYFKAVNDTRGHHVGDQVLREVAAILATSIRNTDYCARYGGEEFALLLPHTNGRKARTLAERIRKRIAGQPIMLDDGTAMDVTISLGVACLVCGDDADKYSLLRHADAALYAAKNGGRNKTCLYKQPLSTKPFRLAACSSA